MPPPPPPPSPLGLLLLLQVDDHCLCVLPGSDIRGIKKVTRLSRDPHVPASVSPVQKVISQSEFFSHCSGFLQVLFDLLSSSSAAAAAAWPCIGVIFGQDLARANDGLIERVVCWDGAGHSH